MGWSLGLRRIVGRPLLVPAKGDEGLLYGSNSKMIKERSQKMVEREKQHKLLAKFRFLSWGDGNVMIL